MTIEEQIEAKRVELEAARNRKPDPFDVLGGRGSPASLTMELVLLLAEKVKRDSEERVNWIRAGREP